MTSRRRNNIETLDGEALRRRLDRFARIKPPLACWITEEDGNWNCELYCSSCLSKIPLSEGATADGGYAIEESEGCCHCAKCGCLLDYVLLPHGVEEELEHFSHVRFTNSRKLDRETAFHIARVIEAAPNDERAIRLASRAVRKIKYDALGEEAS